MVYQFDDIYSDKIIEESKVLFIAGKYPMFNRIIADRTRDFCKGEAQDIDISMFSEWVQENTEEIDRLSFDDYLLYCNTVRVNGQWYCSVDYSTLTKKEKEQLKAHVKTPGTYGKLVVYAREFKDTLEVMRIPATKTSKSINLIRLSYPRRAILQQVVINSFAERGVEVTETAANLFIMRLGMMYERYSEHIEKISNGVKKLDYAEMQAEMQGVTSFMMNDLVRVLIKPTNSDKVIKNRKVYKILNSLISEMGAQRVLNSLSYQIDNMLELRYYINTGAIPVLVPYGVDSVKKRLASESKLLGMPDISFKRNAKIASQTSQKDWLYIKLIIKKAQEAHTEESAMRGLLAIANRAAFHPERLVNDLGVKNVLTEGLYSLNIMEVKDYGSTEINSGEHIQGSNPISCTGRLYEIFCAERNK